jgi:hypothetical protein
VTIGRQPIGLGVVDGGRRVVVADSNLSAKPRATAGLSRLEAVDLTQVP